MIEGKILAALLVGGLLWLDRVFAFQFMLSRPVVVGGVMGAILGDVTLGLVVGAALELLWLNSPPVGAYLPYDESFCAVVSVPVALTASMASPGMSQGASAGLSLLVCLPFSYAGRALDTKIRRLNEGLLDRQKGIGEGDVSRAVVKALARAYVLAVVSIGVSALVLGWAVTLISGVVPVFLIGPLELLPWAVMLGGLAFLSSQSWARPAHAVMFLLGFFLSVLFHPWIR